MFLILTPIENVVVRNVPHYSICFSYPQIQYLCYILDFFFLLAILMDMKIQWGQKTKNTVLAFFHIIMLDFHIKFVFFGWSGSFLFHLHLINIRSLHSEHIETYLKFVAKILEIYRYIRIYVSMCLSIERKMIDV